MLTQADITTAIRATRLAQLIDADSSTFTTAVSTAVSRVKDKLHQHYDTETIFSQAGVNRSLTVLNWLKSITLYLLYERVPDEMVPERIVKNYDDCMEELMKIAEGKIAVDLPRRLDPNSTDGTPYKTKFRWGSQKKRTN